MAIRHKCSDGSTVTQSVIQVRYERSREVKYFYTPTYCECCEQERGTDSDHTIAQARCKVIHKTELIWHTGNYEWSCRVCHKQWENFKSGEWVLHKNVVKRLTFLKEHDPEGFRIRIELTVGELAKDLEKLL
jgi:hypothetical protein